MCAIVDSNVAGSIFGDSPNRPEAARKFREYVDTGKLALVIGGKLKFELAKHEKFKIWYRDAVLSSRVRNISDSDIDNEEAILIKSGNCRSNDQHVLALARITGSRLLNTNDQDLMDDFRDLNLSKRATAGRHGGLHPTRLGRRL